GRMRWPHVQDHFLAMDVLGLFSRPRRLHRCRSSLGGGVAKLNCLHFSHRVLCSSRKAHNPWKRVERSVPVYLLPVRRSDWIQPTSLSTVIQQSQLPQTLIWLVAPFHESRLGCLCSRFNPSRPMGLAVGLLDVTPPLQASVHFQSVRLRNAHAGFE